jgi:hypothetical protein
VAHRRSLNNEAIAVLEASVRSQPVDVNALIAKARAVRGAMKFTGKPLDITKIIREGRDRR